MPVGTKGAVKTILPQELAKIGVEVILCNTYHLALRPGETIIEKLGGLHKFIGWENPILTDSGGYQIFSLAKLCQIDDDGVCFQSHIDGSRLFLTPENILDIEQKLGADIVMPLDQPVPYPCSESEAREGMLRTDKWLNRSITYHNGKSSILFGIVQGGMFENLREESIQRMAEYDVCGYAIGGLSIGEPHDLTKEMIKKITAKLPESKPRYLMGMGKPEDIIFAVSCGVDMFDCILPTRLGRNGWAFTSQGLLKLRNEKYKTDPKPIDISCKCTACQCFSRAYIRHLFNVREILGVTLLSYHNIAFYISLIKQIREAIRENTFSPIQLLKKFGAR